MIQTQLSCISDSAQNCLFTDMKKNHFYQTLIVVLIVIAVAFKAYLFFGNQKQGTTSDKISITTSFYPLYFFTSQIAGDKADVYNITPAGAEPHGYEPTTRDVARIEDSSLLVLNGGNLEPWGNNETLALNDTHTAVISVGELFATNTMQEDGDMVRDPHVWLDPVLAKKMAASILAGVIKVDPANAVTYRANAATLETALDALNQEYVTGLAHCQKKDIITSHAAFSYLAARYGFTQVSISGISPDAEPSAHTLAEVADFAQKNNVQYIFFESLVSPKFAETIAQEVGAQTLVLNPLEGLSDDEIAAGGTYITAMQENLNNLRTALQCQ